VWDAPDLAAARRLVDDYFSQLIERERRLGLGAEAPRADMDGSFAHETEAA
jgi:tetrahydromethanopterin S-methyltransferase subunit F